MFGNLMNNIEQQQAQIKDKLSNTPVSIQNQGVQISGNALREVTDIHIDPSILESGEQEMLEDILLAAFNDFIQAATMIEAHESKQIMSSMLPGGLEDLFK
ncbi:MAG: YbaB/EbfC family nucleoid-associated protein [Chitinophagales bacterium]|nr:YbaB/EbfC family nucleoid-associated protein [Chitinophagales bacterium]